MRKAFALAVLILLALAGGALADALDLYKEGTRRLVAGDFKAAIKVFSEAIDSGQMAPNSQLLYACLLNRGMAHANRQDLDSAIADYNAAIKIDPNRPEAFHNRGRIWHHRRKFDIAIADYDRALALNPRYLNAYLSRAKAYEAMGERAKAAADLAQARQINPAAQMPSF